MKKNVKKRKKHDINTRYSNNNSRYNKRKKTFFTFMVETLLMNVNKVDRRNFANKWHAK